MFDPMLLIPLVLLGAMLIFMWRGNKKRASQQAQLREQMVVGADVMTQAGIYGTIVELDPEHNVTTLETSPGVTLRVHSATVLNVVTPTVPDDASSLADDGLPAPAAEELETSADANTSTSASDDATTDGDASADDATNGGTEGDASTSDALGRYRDKDADTGDGDTKNDGSQA